MTRVLGRTASVLVVCALALLSVSGPAAASVEQIIESWRSDRLHVSPTSTISPDTRIVEAVLDAADAPTYVAVVSQAEADAEELGIDGLTLRLVKGLDSPDAMVLVITDGEYLQAGGGAATGTAPAEALDRIIEKRLDVPFSAETLTSAIVDFTGQTATALAAAQEPEPTSTRRTVGIVGLAVVVALALGAWLQGRARRRAWAAEDAAAEAADDPEHDAPGDQVHARGGGWGGVADREQGRPPG